MNPNHNNQQHQNTPPNQPAPQYTGAWDFLNSPPEPPPKPSFFKTYKKLIIVAGSAIVILLALAILASFSSSSNSSSSTNSPTNSENSAPILFENSYFSMSYPGSLIVNVNEQAGTSDGWFLNFSDSLEAPEAPTYDLSVELNSEEIPFSSSEEAVSQILSGDSGATNVTTTNITLAGVPTQKTTAEFFSDTGQEMIVVYTAARVGSKSLIISGTYQKSSQYITDNFDTMASSIIVK